MTETMNCKYTDPVVADPNDLDGNWTLIPLGEAPLGVKPVFEFSSSTCYSTGTPETINGFTYGEVFICFFLIVFSIALIFNFLFIHFIKER